MAVNGVAIGLNFRRGGNKRQPFFSDLDTLYSLYEELTTLINDVVTYETDDIYYKYTPLTVLSQNANLSFAVDIAANLYTSLDNSLSFTHRKKLNTSKDIRFAHNFQNGNILFGTKNKLYLTKDNFNTITEVIVTDLLGNPVIMSGTNDYFLRVSPDKPVIISGSEHLMWGNYTNVLGVPGSYAEVRIYHTTDNGETVKVIYEFGQNSSYGNLGDPLNSIIARHVHSVNYNPYQNLWIFQTGDFGTTTSDFECHWGIIQFDGTNYSIDIIKSGGDSGYYKAIGMLFEPDGDVVVGGDWANTIGTGTIIKVPYATLLNPATYTKLLSTAYRCLNIKGDDNDIVAVINYEFDVNGTIYSSNNRVDFNTTVFPLAGVDENMGLSQIYSKNNLGFYLANKYFSGLNGGRVFLKVK